MRVLRGSVKESYWVGLYLSIFIFQCRTINTYSLQPIFQKFPIPLRFMGRKLLLLIFILTCFLSCISRQDSTIAGKNDNGMATLFSGFDQDANGNISENGKELTLVS